MTNPEAPAVITVPDAGTYVLDHQLGSVELWKIGDEEGLPLNEPELADVAVDFG